MYYFLATTVPPVAEAIGGSLEKVQTDTLSTISVVAPYGVAIMGAFLVWKYGLRFFKAIAK